MRQMLVSVGLDDYSLDDHIFIEVVKVIGVALS